MKKKYIGIYSTYNEIKSAVQERFIRTLKNKTYKHMKAASKDVYFDVLDDTVNKYNNTSHKLLKWSLQILNLIIMQNSRFVLTKKS